MGPIQIFLLGFENFQAAGSLADELSALSAAGTIRIIDARFLVRESEHEIAAVRVSELQESECEDLRSAAGALVDLGAVAALPGEDGATAGAILGADAALDVAELGMSEAEVGELAEELDVGDALLLLVIENVWATVFAAALREAGVVFAQQDFLSLEGLVALGAMLELEVAIDG